MATRGVSQGPFFRFPAGRPLTRELLVEHLRIALRSVGVDPSDFAGHSFRIGAATILGQWQSSAYQCYLQIPKENLATISRVLSSE